MTRYLTIFILFFLNTLLSFSQDTANVLPMPKNGAYTFNLKYHYGFVMNHSKNMAHLANQHTQGIELDVYRQTNGKKSWQSVHNFPIIGYSFQYVNLDHNKPLGDMWSAVIYYSQKIPKGRKFFFSYRVGLGLGYVEKRFNIHNNYKNNLISSRINYALNGRLGFTCKISEKILFNTGIGILHLSNGAMKVPNLGINIPSIHVGLGYTPVKTDFKSHMENRDYKSRINLVLAGGFKQVYPVEGRSYFISTLSSYYSSQVSRRSELNVGMDIFYDGSNKMVLDTIAKSKKLEYFKLGVAIGHEYLIDKVSLLAQIGFYLYDPLKLNKISYQRVAIKYSFRKIPLFLSLGLKTHFFNADFVEWGVGVKL